MTYNEKTLLRVAGVVDVLGIVVMGLMMVVSLILVIVSFVGLADGQRGAGQAVAAGLGGIIGALLVWVGFTLAAQSVACLAAIERNTRGR